MIPNDETEASRLKVLKNAAQIGSYKRAWFGVIPIKEDSSRHDFNGRRLWLEWIKWRLIDGHWLPEEFKEVDLDAIHESESLRQYWHLIEQVKELLASAADDYNQTIGGYSPNSRDCFISHAKEDKRDIVEPLTSRLDETGITYWYDLAEINGEIAWWA